MAAPQGDAMNFTKRRHTIPPKPIIMRQDMEGYSVPICISEIADNAIRASAGRISIESGRTAGAITTLRCSDDGCGMTLENAENFMRLAHTDSGLVYGYRVHGKPLSAAQYFSKNLSRHGKGALALLYFGSKITVTTKLSSTGCVKVQMNYQDWLTEYEETKNCSYGVDVYELIQLDVDDEHYTDIEIGDLKNEIVVKLTDSKNIKQWAQELGDIYHFHIYGFPERLWSTMDPVLRPDLPVAAAAGGRPTGGVQLSLFGHTVSHSHMSGFIEKFIELQDEYGADRLKPFWLPIRWCLRGLSADAVPDNVKPSDGFDKEGVSGPAGKLEGVHRDFLLLLMYFPTRAGLRSKPVVHLAGCGGEVCLFPIWSGRLMPEADCVRTMPAFVNEAGRQGLEGTHKLNKTRLGGFLFCSPEVYTTNHKTNFQDYAFKRVMQLGGGDPGPDYEDLYIWNGKWVKETDQAILMLQQHFRTYWRDLEHDGELVDSYLDKDTRKSKKYKFADGSIIEAGQLVRIRDSSEMQEADMAKGQTAATPLPAAAAGSSAAAAAVGYPSPAAASGRGSAKKGTAAAAGGGSTTKRGRPSSSSSSHQHPGHLHPHEYPSNYRVVVEFVESSGGDSSGHQVLLRHWTPTWCPAEYTTVHCPDAPRQVAQIAAVGRDSQSAQREAQRLTTAWEQQAPHHLAWVDSRQLYEHANQVAGVPGSDTIAPAQVPKCLTVGLATCAGQRADLSKDKWGGRMVLGKLECDCTLTRDGVQCCRRPIKYFDSKKGFVFNELAQFAQQPGSYVLTFKAQASFISRPISYSFKVAETIPTKLVASWQLEQGAADGVPRVAVGEQLPALVIKTKDEAGKVSALPFSSDEELRTKKVLKITLRTSDQQGRATEFKDIKNLLPYLSEDRTAIWVSGWKLSPQSLPGAHVTQVTALVTVELTVGGSRLTLQSGEHPHLYIQSGPPALIEAEKGISADEPDLSTRGSKVLLPSLVVVDESNNPVDMDNKSFCACLYFKPQTAAAAVNKSATYRTSDAAGSSSSKRRGAAASCEFYKCTVDGNVLECPHELRWRAAPGKQVVAVIKLFAGANLPADPVRKSALISREVHFRMQLMHSIPDHPLIRKLIAPDYLLTRWRAGGRGRVVRDQQQPQDGVVSAEAYELNTSDDCPPDKLAANMPEAALSNELKSRLMSAYELRRDIMAGRMVDTYIVPDGSLLLTSQPCDAVERKLPRALVDHWNSLPKAVEHMVYKVVFVVPHHQQQLDGLRMTLCTEEDHHDLDFVGRVKLVWQNGAHRIPVLPSDITTEITGGVLHLPAIPIKRHWFDVHNRGTATLLLLDTESVLQQQTAPQQSPEQQQQPVDEADVLYHAPELGRVHVRLAPYAEQLSVLPAGCVFEGVRVTGRFGAELDKEETRLLMTQDIPQATSTTSSITTTTGSSSSVIGAWAPWRTQKINTTDNSRPASAGRSAAAAAELATVHYRGLRFDDPVRLRLGERVVLHFIAQDLVGCPVAVTADQAEWMKQQGVRVEQEQQQQQSGGEADSNVQFDIEASDWHFAAPPGVQCTQQLPPRHMGGLLVNSVTVTILSGVGPANIVITVKDSADQPSVYKLRVLVEAGPVAVDGLWLKSVAYEQSAAAVGGVEQQQQQQQVDRVGVLVDRHTWQMLQVVKAEEPEPAAAAAAAAQVPQQGGPPEQEAAAASGVQIKPDPEQPTGGAQHAAAAGSAPAAGAAADADVVDLVSDDDDHDDGGLIMILSDDDDDDQQHDQMDLAHRDQQQQQNPDGQAGHHQQQQARQVPRQNPYVEQLAALDRSKAAVLYKLEVTEGSVMKLSMQLRDSEGHEVADYKKGRLQLLHHKGWQQPSPTAAAAPQQQQQQPDRVSGPVVLRQGRADLKLTLGAGDHWLGDQLYEITPVHTAAAAAAAGSSGGSGELQQVLPVLLLLTVKPGALPCKLELITDLTAAAADAGALGVVSAADAIAAAAPAAAVEHLRSQTSGEFACCLELCMLGSPAPAAASSSNPHQVQAVVMQLQDSTAAAAGEGAVDSEVPALPAFSIAVHARNGAVLQPSSLQQLRVSLHRWIPPTAAAAAANSNQQQQQPGGTWQEVSGPPLHVPAKLRCIDSNADIQQQQQQQDHVPGSVAAVYDMDAGALHLPEVAGIYKLCASYTAAAAAAAAAASVVPVDNLYIGPFLLLPAQPSRLVNLAVQQQQQQQQQPNPLSTPTRRGRGKMSASSSSTVAPAAASPVAAAAAVSTIVVPVDGLDAKQFGPVQLQLQDKWSHPWRAAVAAVTSKLAAAGNVQSSAAAAAAPVRNTTKHVTNQQQQQSSQSSDPVAGILTTPQRGILKAILAEPVQQQRQQDGDKPEPPAKRRRTINAQQQQQQKWQVHVFAVKTPSSRGHRVSDSSSEQQQQQDEVWSAVCELDADGVCHVPQQSLPSIGIAAAGDYKVYAVARLTATAAAAAAAAGGGGGGGSSLVTELPQLLLARYRVARSINRVAILERQTQLQERVRLLSSTAQNAQQTLSDLEEQKQAREYNMQQINQQLAAARQQQEQHQRQEAALQHHRPENAPCIVLTRNFTAGGQPLAPQTLLHPRALVQAQGGRGGWEAAAAAAEVIQRDLFALDGSWVSLHESGGFWGPLLCLGSVERADVARLLSAYLHRYSRELVVTSYQASQQLKRGGRPVSCLNLGQTTLLSDYSHNPHRQQQRQQALANNGPWLSWHPQQLIQPRSDVIRLFQAVGASYEQYSADVGFIGFAENLIRLTPQQLNLRLQVQAEVDRYGRLRRSNNRMTAPLSLSLRETLWHMRLRDVLVFENEGSIRRFRERMDQAGVDPPGGVRLLGLDGSTFNHVRGYENTWLTLPQPGSASLLLSGVSEGVDVLPVHQQDYHSTGGALDLRLRCYMGVNWQVQNARTAVENIRRELTQLKSQHKVLTTDLKKAQEAVRAAQTQQQQEEPRCVQELDRLRAELQEDEQGSE